MANPEVQLAADPNAYTGGGMGVVPPPQAPITRPAGLNLPRNPMLPQHPLGAFTDSQYEADMAQYRQNLAANYGDILQQLGYTDEMGHYIPGSVEVQANRDLQENQRNQDLATEGVTKDMQQAGTLFSGIRGDLTGRAQYPFASAIARLNTDTPLALQSLWEKAGGLIGQYQVNMQQALAQAAARQAAGLTAGGGGTPTTPTPAPVGGPGAPAPPFNPMTANAAEITANVGQTSPDLTGTAATSPATQATIARSAGMANDPYMQGLLGHQQSVADIHKASLSALAKGHQAASNVPSSIGSFIR